jgi:hypothetical protein
MKTYTYNEAVVLFTQPDFIYKIYNEIDLEGHTLTLPSGCTLDFQGGLFTSSSNGAVLNGNGALVLENGGNCFRNITKQGMISSDGNPIDAPNSGTSRPNGVQVGFLFFDTSLGKPIFYKGNSVWVDATGASA